MGTLIYGGLINGGEERGGGQCLTAEVRDGVLVERSVGTRTHRERRTGGARVEGGNNGDVNLWRFN